MHRPILIALAVTLGLLAGCATPPADPASGEPQASASGAFNVIGRDDAPVTIIEFTDLQCPYCARYASQTFPRLKREYVDTGKLRNTSRDLPLPFHDFALPAAIASRCAGEQGRFWEYREALFAAQDSLGTAPYARIARELGLDVGRLEACRGDGRQAANVRGAGPTASRAVAAPAAHRRARRQVISRRPAGE